MIDICFRKYRRTLVSLRLRFDRREVLAPLIASRRGSCDNILMLAR